MIKCRLRLMWTDVVASCRRACAAGWVRGAGEVEFDADSSRRKKVSEKGKAEARGGQPSMNQQGIVWWTRKVSTASEM